MKAFAARLASLERSAPKGSPVVILDAYDMEPAALEAELKRLHEIGAHVIIDDIPRDGAVHGATS